MLQWITKILDKVGSPELDWIQVEVTSHCNAACIYCPQHLIGKKQHMPLTLFKRLLPYLGYTNLIYLQGWGEPLLNRDLFAMIEACKAKDKRVGFTTNGMLLNEETVLRLVDLEVDILSVSLAGTNPSTHNRIRKGTDLAQIIANLERLRQIKEQKGALRPALHLAYIMLVSNFNELPEVVGLAKRLGAEQVVGSNLALIAQEALRQEALFNQQEKGQHFIIVLEGVAREARREKLLFSYSSPLLQERSEHCSENTNYSCVVSVEGEVSPCVFISPTLSVTAGINGCKAMARFYQNRPVACYPLSFGNIGSESLTRIWNKKEYLQFKRFYDPETKNQNMGSLQRPQSCMSCYKSFGA